MPVHRRQIHILRLITLQVAIYIHNPPTYMKEESRYSDQEIGTPEHKEAPRRKVLKISEMAVSIDGQYVGESGNPSYGEQKGMFEYDPESGLLVTGLRDVMLLTKDDLVRVPHALGHVTVERLLGDKQGRYSDREFERKLYEIFDGTRNKINKITFLGQLMDVEWDTQDTDLCINRIASRNPQFSPEELMGAVSDELKNRYHWQHHSDEIKENELTQVIESLHKTGVLDADPKKSRDGIVGYFYLSCRLRGIDASNSDSIYNEGFNNFIFLDELMKEYKRQPDVRFGDALLVACSRQQHEWNEQEGKENDS